MCTIENKFDLFILFDSPHPQPLSKKEGERGEIITE